MENTQWIYEMTRHSHDQYKVDLCSSICGIVQEKLLRNLGKEYIKVVTQPRVFLPIPMWYESNHVNRCPNVEHGIKPLDYRSMV